MKKHPLIPIAMIVFADVLALTILMPLFPFYAEKFGASPGQIGALVSVFALCQFIAGPVLGKWSDQWGRRPILLVSQMGTFAGLLVLAFAQSLLMLFVGRIIDGLTAGNLTVAQAAIADVTAPKDRVRAFGIIGVSFGVGFLIGPAISGFLVVYGINAPLFAAAGFSLLSIAGTYFLLPEKVRDPESEAAQEKGLFIPWTTWKRLLSHPHLGLYLSQFFLFSWIFASFTSGFALFAERRFQWNGQAFGAREVGFVLAGLGLYGILLQGGVVGRLNKAVGEMKMALMGFAACVVGYAFLSESFAFGTLGIALAVSSFGTGVLRPAISSLLSQAASPSEQGLVLGVSQSLGSIAQILAPLLVGFLIGNDQLKFWCWQMAFVAAGAVVISLQSTKRESI